MGLEVIDLTVEVYDYQNQGLKRILDQVSVQVKPGELTGIIGEIGSGKSTFIQYLNGLKKASTGKIFIQQQQYRQRDRTWLQKVGIVLQFSQQQLFLPTVAEEIMYAAKNFGCEISLAHLCERVKLDEQLLTRHPQTLSGGQMRKVAIASVLASDPDIVILDEPFAGLDWDSQMEITQLLQQLVNEKMTVIVVSHDLHFVYEHCTRVLVFSQGKLVADETPQHLFLQTEKCETLGIGLPDLLATQFVTLDQTQVKNWIEGECVQE
ncbi:MAG: energy-coupling factor ABC transporter ATP-binding protein [Culicoidibacterales bacterium]